MKEGAKARLKSLKARLAEMSHGRTTGKVPNATSWRHSFQICRVLIEDDVREDSWETDTESKTRHRSVLNVQVPIFEKFYANCKGDWMHHTPDGTI